MTIFSLQWRNISSPHASYVDVLQEACNCSLRCFTSTSRRRAEHLHYPGCIATFGGRSVGLGERQNHSHQAKDEENRSHVSPPIPRKSCSRAARPLTGRSGTIVDASVFADSALSGSPSNVSNRRDP